MKPLFLSAFILSCLAGCGGGGGSASANGTVAEIIPTDAQTFSFSSFQIGNPQDVLSDALKVHSMSFTPEPPGLGGSVIVSFSLYILGKPKIKEATFTGKWDKVRSGDEFAITIDKNLSDEIQFEANQLKLQVLNTTLLPNGRPSSCNAQFTGGSISVKSSLTTFNPVGNTVEIQYTYGE
ncbi:MAG: hypothetical protein E7030_00970 [Akkermansiaceae bacterium]|nr:hypothetical protein [Akkermansiaceae bacterium]